MTKYREILRLTSLGLSQQSIADSCGVSKKTVNRVLKKAAEEQLIWPLDPNLTDAVVAERFFPSAKQAASDKKMPDFAPQFCHYIRQDEQKRRATMQQSITQIEKLPRHESLSIKETI